MKDELRDELAELLKEQKQNNRHDIWVWLCLYHYKRVNLDPDTCNGNTMRSVIARFLKRNTDLIEQINRGKDRSLVPDDCFKWIDVGERQYQWLVRRIERITDLRLSQDLVHLTGRNHLIAMLDLWDVDLAKKAGEIEHLRKEWLQHRARDSDFEWFEDKKEGPQRCKCAWEWLEKNPINRLKTPLLISNYEELLMYFDEAGPGRNEQKAIIEKIRSRWHRKRFDVRTADKKQVNVLLSKTAITLLDELAKKHDQKRAQVLEHLIRKASERGMTEEILHPSRTGRGGDRDRQQ